MNTLKGILGSLNTGFDRGIAHGGQLAQIFAQKRQMEMMEEQKDAERAQQNYKRAMDLISLESPEARKVGIQLLQAQAMKRPKDWGGQPPDFAKIFTVNEGTEELDQILKSIREVRTKNLSPPDQSAVLSAISKRISSLPTRSAQQEANALFDDVSKETAKRQDAFNKMIAQNKLRMLSPEEQKRAGRTGGMFGYGQYGKQAAEPKLTVGKDTDEKGNVTYKWFDEGGKEVKAVTYPKAGKPGSSGTTINIGQKVEQAEALDMAALRRSINKPEFRDESIAAVKSVQGNDFKYMDESKKELAIREEMNKRIKIIYKSAVFEDGKDGLGWYDGDKLIRLAD